MYLAALLNRNKLLLAGPVLAAFFCLPIVRQVGGSASDQGAFLWWSLFSLILAAAAALTGLAADRLLVAGVGRRLAPGWRIGWQVGVAAGSLCGFVLLQLYTFSFALFQWVEGWRAITLNGQPAALIVMTAELALASLTGTLLCVAVLALAFGTAASIVAAALRAVLLAGMHYLRDRPRRQAGLAHRWATRAGVQ